MFLEPILTIAGCCLLAFILLHSSVSISPEKKKRYYIMMGIIGVGTIAILLSLYL